MIEEAYTYEMSEAEKKAFDETPSQVIPVRKIDKALDDRAIVEGLLYVVGEEGVKADQLAMALDKPYEVIADILKDIKKRYDDSSYGIELVDYGGSYKFLSKAAIYPHVAKLLDLTKANSLSQSALETLSIIAYKQPITRIEIEELRGVGCDVMLRKLSSRGLIREAGRSDAPGRPILYEVTEDFLDSFKLASLEDLPELPSYDSDEESESLFSE